MSNPIKDEFEKASLSKDIAERNRILRLFQETGFLDRDDAINKILIVRIGNEDVAKVTTANLLVHATPFNQASDSQIVDELIMQRDILLAKLTEKTSEEKK